MAAIASINILVVDDEKDISETIVEALSMEPCRKIINANSPSEAYMRSVGTKFDLIITDYRMPKTSGSDLFKVIRQQKHNAGVPVLVVTGYPDEVTAKLKDFVDVQVMAKPFMVEDLVKKVDEMLSLHRATEKKEEVLIESKLVFDMNILNEFIFTTSSVIKILTGMEEIKKDKPFIFTKETQVKIDISGMIHIQTDKFKGTVVIGFSEPTFLKLINGFTKGSDRAINSENEIHINSILTLIQTQAIENLAAKKINLLNTNLQVITGVNHRIAALEQQTTLVVPMQALIGSFYLFAVVG